MKAKKNLMITAILAGTLFAAGCGQVDSIQESVSDALESAESTEAAETTESTSADASEESTDSSEDSYIALKDMDVESYVTLGEYLGLEINVDPAEEISEDYANAYTSQLYFDTIGDPGSGTTDRAVAIGDTINLDYSGSKDGEVFDGGTAESQLLTIGSDTFIDGFEDGLVGVMPGETVDLNLTFPENYGSSDLAGQDVVFTCTVNYICEMDDSQVESLGYTDVTTVDQLYTYVREQLQQSAESTYFSNASSALLEQIMENSTFADELPADKMAEIREMIAEQMESYAQSYYGVDAETYFGYFSLDYETTLDEYAEESTRQLLIVQAIANAEGLNLSDDDVNAKLDADGEEYGLTREEMLEQVSFEEARENYLYEDVMQYLIDNSVNTEAAE